MVKIRSRSAAVKVFVSMNADGELVVTSAKRHREELNAFRRDIERAGGIYADPERTLETPPGALDLKGRLKIPSEFRSWLST
jgi:hypothetical protein